MRAALLLVLVGAASGCAVLGGGEGGETLVIRNQDVQPLTVSLIITQEVGNFRIFSENVFLSRGEMREVELGAKPGRHVVDITTSTSVSERLYIEIPQKGHTTISVDVKRGGATVSTTVRS